MATDPLDPSNVKALSEMMANAQKMSKAFEELAKNAKELATSVKQTSDDTKKILDSVKGISEEEEKTEKKTKDRITSKYSLAKVAIEELAAIRDLTPAQQSLLDTAGEMLKYETEISKVKSETAKWDKQRTIDAAITKQQMEDELGLFSRLKNAMQMKESDSAAKARARAKYDVDKDGNAVLKEGESVSRLKQAANTVKELTSSLGNIKNLSADSFVAQISQLGPVGAILGLMISGRMEDMKWGAVGAGIKQQFDVIGGASSEFGAKMAGTARALTVASMASEKDLQAVGKALAEVGISGKEAAASIGALSTSVGGIKIDNLMTATLALDKKFEMAAGSVAKLVGEFARLSNIEGREALMSLGSIGMAAEKAGANVATFMSQTLEASSSLKLFNANVGDVGELQLSQMNNLRGRGFTKASSQMMAAAGSQQAAQGFAGMSDGMAALLGEKVFGKQGIEGWYATKSALGRGGNNDMQFDKFIEETRKLVTSQTGDRATQVMMLNKFGFGIQGAESILDFKPDSKGNMSKELREAIRSGMMTEADKTSAMERHLAAIRDGILQVAAGLLQAIVSGIKGLWLVVRGIAKYLEEGFRPWTDHSKSSGYFNAAGAAGLEGQDAFFRAVNAGVGVAKHAGAAFGTLLNAGNTKWSGYSDKELSEIGTMRGGSDEYYRRLKATRAAQDAQDAQAAEAAKAAKAAAGLAKGKPGGGASNGPKRAGAGVGNAYVNVQILTRSNKTYGGLGLGGLSLGN